MMQFMTESWTCSLGVLCQVFEYGRIINKTIARRYSCFHGAELAEKLSIQQLLAPYLPLELV